MVHAPERHRPTVTGVLAAIHAHLPILRTPWILGSIVLFSISGLLFGVRVAPLQRTLREMTHAGMAGGFEYATYHRLVRA